MVFGGGAQNDIEITIRADGSAAVREIEQTGQAAETAATGFTGLQASIVTAQSALSLLSTAAAGLRGAFNFVGELAQTGETLGSLRASFDQLGGSADSINRARDASLGLVRELDLLRISNQGLLLDIPNLNDNFEKIADAGARLANTLGRDVTGTIDQLTQAIGRGQTRQLQQLGILVDQREAYERYAESIGKSVDALTESERVTARQQEALRQLDGFLESTEAATDSVANAAQALSIAYQDLRDRFSEAFNSNEQLTETFRKLADSIRSNEDVVDRLAEIFADFINFLFEASRRLIAEIQDLESRIRLFIDTLLRQVEAAGRVFRVFVGDIQGARRALAELELNTRQYGQELERLDRLGAVATLQKQRFAEAAIEAGGAVLEGAKEFLAGTGILERLGLAAEEAAESLDATSESTETFARTQSTAAKAFEEASQKAEQFGATLRDNLGISERVKEFERLELLLFDLLLITGPLEQQTEEFAASLESIKQAFPLVEGEEFLRLLERLQNETREFRLDAINLNSTGVDLGQTLKQQFQIKDDSFFGSLFDGLNFDLGSEGLNDFAGSVAASALQIVPKVFEGSNRDIANLAILAIATAIGAALGSAELGAAVGTIIVSGISALERKFRTSQKNTLARRAIEGFIEERLQEQFILIRRFGQLEEFTNFDLPDKADFNTFADEIVPALRETAPEIFEQFVAVFGALGAASGLAFGDGAAIGAVLFNEFQADLDNLRLLVQVLGVSFEELQDGIVSAFLKGELSALGAASALRDLPQAFEPGLVAFAAFEDATENLIESAGSGRFAIKSLQDIAIEALEGDITSLEELRQELIASGRFTTEQIDAFFAALEQNGITTLEELAEVSDLVAIGILGALEASGVFFAEIAEEIEEAAETVKSLREGLEQINNTTITTDVVLRVRSEFDSNETRNIAREIDQGEALAA